MKKEEDKLSPFEVVDKSLKELKATEGGLTSEEARARLKHYGLNTLTKKKKSKKRASTLSALEAQLKPTTRALRDGEQKRINAEELVPGDIIILTLGELVPADVIILPSSRTEAEDLKLLNVDQSALSGSSLPFDVHAGKLVYAGSVIKSGEAKALVKLTGCNTFFGQAACLIEEPHHGRSRVSRKCQVALADQAGVLVVNPSNDNLKRANVVVSMVSGIFSTNKLLAEVAYPPCAKKDKVVELRALVGAVACCGRLAHDTLDTAIIETFESRNKQDDDGGEKEDEPLLAQNIAEGVLRLELFNPSTKYSLALCRSSSLHLTKTKKKKDKEAVVVYVRGAVKAILPSCRRIIKRKGKEEELTPSHREQIEKLMEGGGGRYMAVASKIVKKGKKPLKSKRRLTMEDIKEEGEKEEEGGWCLLAIISLQERPRPNVREEAQRLLDMGLRIVLVSGADTTSMCDFVERHLGWDIEREKKEEKEKKKKKKKETKEEAEKESKKQDDETQDEKKKPRAVEISQELLYKEEANKLDWAAILADREGVMVARCYPEDKWHIVKGLQRAGYVVAMFGDGVGDGPAMKAADVSIALNDATDAARSSADLILYEDPLSSLVTAIEILKQDEGGKCILA